MRTRWLIAPVAASLLGLIPGSASHAGSAEFAVTTTVDAVDADSPGPFDGVCATANGQCSLRAAIQEANELAGPDTIIVPPGTYPLTIGPAGDDLGRIGDLDVTDDLTIAGSGPTSTVLDGMGLDRVLDVTAGASSLIVRDLSIRGGMANPGGGILVQATDSIVERVVLSGNASVGGPAGGGWFGTVTMTDTLITGNSASGQGGGVLVGEDSVLTNVTVTGNSTLNDGGGISTTGSGTRLNAVTVTNNTADSDGGGFGSWGGIHADFVVLTLENSVVAGNVDGSPAAEAPDCGGAGTVASGANNLIGDGTGCSFTAQTGDQVGAAGAQIDPRLGPLVDNGGPTMTQALLFGSPAIDAGGPDCPVADQRGLPRPQGAGCDIGAYELALCATVPVNRFGTEANDVLIGTTGSDGVLGFGGNDRIMVGEGNDAACGGAGKDRISGGGGKDRLLGEVGKDTLKGQGGKDRLHGGGGRDSCVGGGGKDRAVKCEQEKSIP